MKKLLCCFVLFCFLTAQTESISVNPSEVLEEVSFTDGEKEMDPESKAVKFTESEVECIELKDIEINSTTYSIPYEDIELIALVTMAEAEGESVDGKRLVIDTILNRIDSVYFPNTAYDVIYQPNQFSSMWNGRVDRCQITDEVIQLVIEELENRYNYETIFFNANHYSMYGCPLFQVGNHYFSSY